MSALPACSIGGGCGYLFSSLQLHAHIGAFPAMSALYPAKTIDMKIVMIPIEE